MKILILLVLVFAAGCGRSERKAGITLYASPAATTPQLPWLAAEKWGSLESCGEVERLQWRSAMQVQSLMLGGKGDFWVASVDTVARARNAGANVQLLAVTGWRKWQLIGRKDVGWRNAVTSGSLVTCPPGNPAGRLLAALFRENGIETSEPRYMESRQLMLKMLSGQEKLCLIAQPLTGVLLEKNEELVKIASAEEIKMELCGGEARIPWAGIAVNTETLKNNPELGEKVLTALTTAAGKLAAMQPEEVSEIWPPEYHDTISREVLENSLADDVILAVPAYEVADEINAFLAPLGIEIQDNLIYRPNP